MREDKFGKTEKDAIKAFEIVFKSHYVRLTLFANKFLNELNVSEEIVSESLTYFWENRENLSCSSNTAYLYKMVQNKCMNYIKHQKVENEYVSYMIRNNLIHDLPEHSADPMEEKELAAQIRIAIDALPEKCRRVFILSRFHYLKNREIAEKLQISTNTVERHITIALDKLRKHLEYIVTVVLLYVL